MAGKFRTTVKEVGTDPGVLWSICDVLLFATTNLLGTVAMALSAVTAATCKTLAVTQPDFFKKHPKLAAILTDERTPLRAGGMASLVVMGATLAAGMILPAVTGFFFAMTFFKVADSISKAARGEPDLTEAEQKLPLWKRAVKLFFKRPDFYTAAGTILGGLMSGGAALWALPLVAAGFAISFGNILKQKPEHAGHPKVLYALSAVVFSIVGFGAGEPLLGLAQALNFGVFLNVESRITPGGFSQVLRDLREGAVSLFTKKKTSKPEARVVSGPEPQTASSLMDKNLSASFQPKVAPHAPEENKPGNSDNNPKPKI